MNSAKFTELYKQLNPEQKKAVDTIEGPVMVIAGPGTGKTQILTLRIANILLKTQVNPGNILALTFSESGAVTMRRRLAEIIGPTAYQVRIATFHGFCNELIQTYPAEFTHTIGRRSASEIEQIDLMQMIIDELPLEFLKTFGEPYFYLYDIRRSIGFLKKEGINPEEFAHTIHQQEQVFANIDDLYYTGGRYEGKMKGKYADLKKQLDKNRELAKIYETYQERLAEAKRYDYDDMILEVAQTLASNSELLLLLQERFQYFLVDEHQDTNNAQNRVLELLSNFYDQPNLFVVGDEKQAVFRFQGASLENFLYFKKLYPTAQLITLRQNYRSTQSILNLAHDLIQKNSRRLTDEIKELGQELNAQSKYPEKLAEVYEFQQSETENFFLAEKIHELIDSGVPAKEIAVLYRDNQDALVISEMLEKCGLPFRVESGNNALRDADVRALLDLLKWLADPTNEEKLFNILHLPWLNLPALHIYKIVTPGVRRKLSLLEMLGSTTRRKALELEAGDKIGQLADQLLRWQKLAVNTNLGEMFETVARESGYLSYILAKPNSALALARLNSVFREVKKLVVVHPEAKLVDFVKYLNTLEEHRVAVKEGNAGYIPNAVRLMTAHGAKGLEFDYVFLVNVYDGHWGNRRIPQLIKILAKTSAKLEDIPELKTDDERRLFYVAVTRARKLAFISYALQGSDGREQSPSQFILEIKSELKQVGPAEQFEKMFAGKREVLYQLRITPGWSVFEKDFLRELFFKRGLSATGLNNWLSCPWKYFYLNLLRVPRVKNKYQIYGTAIHAALKEFFDASKNGPVEKGFLEEYFVAALEGEPLLPKDYAAVLAKGKFALSKYFANYEGSWRTNTQNEFRINSVYLPLRSQALDERPIKLTGVLDKIEYLDGGETVNVVDYKTGKAKTRNELEGKTKNATGDYPRQLAFYKLLLDNYPTFTAEMISGEIDFVEPDSNGKFQREKFIITATETTALQEQIFDLAEQVLEFKFWDKRCDDKDCEFCALRNKVG